MIEAIRDDDPVIFFENKVLYQVTGDVPEEPYALPFGEAEIVREGSDVTVVAIGRMVSMAEQAAEVLDGEGIDVEIVDPRTTSPLDLETIFESVEGTGRLVIVDESNPRGSLAADISAQVAQERFDRAQGADPHGHGAAHAAAVLVGAGGRIRPERRRGRGGGARRRRGGRGVMTAEGIAKLTMPKWGLSMTEGTVLEWLVDEGAEIASGQEIAEVETDKLSGAVEAQAAGTLRKQVAQAGEKVPVGGLLGVVAPAEVPDEDVDAFVADFVESFEPEEEADAGPQPETVEVDGRRIRYLRHGEGDPIVLLHGFGGDLDNWLFNRDALAEAGEVVAIDLPGHGGSSKEIRDAGLEELTGVLGGVLDALGLERVHLVGHSLGGAVAAAWAAEHPDRVASLTLIAGAGLGEAISDE